MQQWGTSFIDAEFRFKKIVLSLFPELGERGGEEIIQFVSKMATPTESRKATIFKLDSRSYWNIFGPCLYFCAKSVNEMICSSTASGRVWSIFRFIHSRLRNPTKKWKKLAFIYIKLRNSGQKWSNRLHERRWSHYKSDWLRIEMFKWDERNKYLVKINFDFNNKTFSLQILSFSYSKML